jgi:DNA-binding transcriptional regulator YhcF (GntR family)
VKVDPVPARTIARFEGISSARVNCGIVRQSLVAYLHAMRLWLSKSREVPLREQLVTQIILGSQQRPQSKRTFAQHSRPGRRYTIRANTVSATFRELTRLGWVEFRNGSGVYVKERAAEHRICADEHGPELVDKLT